MAEVSTTSFKKGYKFPIYPITEQKELLEKTFGCCRYVYNRALAESKADYEKYIQLLEKRLVDKQARPDVSGYGLTTKLPRFKRDPDSTWLSDVSNVALQQSLLHLGAAYARFFRTKQGFPRFKRKQDRQSFSLTKGAFNLQKGVLRIAKCATPIKVVYTRPLPSTPSSLTISRTPSGQYYVSFTCEYQPMPTSGTQVTGVDVGLNHLLVLSNGIKINNPRHYVKAQKQLKHAQQALSRKQKGSRNRHKQRLRVAKLHERVANCRRDHHHQLSRKLINENQVIGIEGLQVKNMIKNRRLSKHIADAGWRSFRSMLEYKTVESQHVTLVIMDTFFPSSHLCAVTGQKLDRKLLLSERDWECPHCDQVHDRDVNAAQVIASEALFEVNKHSIDVVRGKILLSNARPI